MTRLVGSVSHVPSRVTPSLTTRDGEAEPTGLAQIKDPELRAAVKRAYRAWAAAKAPWLLEESAND